MRMQLHAGLKKPNGPYMLGMRKARVRKLFLTGRLLPEAPMILQGPENSMQLCRPFSLIDPWKILVGLVLLFL